MPIAVVPVLIGVALAPMVKRLARPVLRGAVKTSVGIAYEVKQAASEVGEEITDLSAEIVAEMAAKREPAPVATKKNALKPGGRAAKAKPAQ
ncbi:hypothetical protein GCM10010372_81880 [Streptomyces tauricus]|uniref:DUF5132 domain-containing protein n=1 Tax=Streptomyces tauricus TaxID=68274 RepID=UPI0016745F9F|nr:DUF5132 domain-containing protein [Streptomyces tauricus]GHA70269.1 hypothetical protein GCM10010372_81880 [Streptomyces tauricus]